MTTVTHPAPIDKGTELAKADPSALPPNWARRGATEAQWRTMFNLFPGANPASVLMVWDYCKARQLDPLKKPCHIVPMRVKNGTQWETRDVVMPGIYELRTTAQRTGEYLGHAKPVYGPSVECAGVTAPEWCEFVVYRWNDKLQARVEYPVTVFFSEVVATKQDGKANERWGKAPIQMLTKCAEAAALRAAFPDEIGGEHTDDEMYGRDIGGTTTGPASLPAAIDTVAVPEQYDEFIAELARAALKGSQALQSEMANWPPPVREYLTRHQNAQWEALKTVARENEPASTEGDDASVL